MNRKELDKKFNREFSNSFKNIPDEDVEALIVSLHQMNEDDVAINVCFDRQRFDLLVKIKELRLCSKLLAERKLILN